MQAVDIHNLELLLLFLLALVVVFAALARRFQTPYPIVLVVGGLALSLLPGIPRVRLNPDVVFLVLLPPLIFATAFHTSWQNMRRNLGTILTLAFGLVGFTVVAVAFATERLLPGFDRRIGFVLGALVASTDAIAASAIARRMRLPQRIIDILEGESLVNDVSALVALDFAVSILVNNHAPSMTEGCLRLLYLALGGIAVGLAAGVIIRRGQTRITDAPIEITLTLVAPYIAYMAAEGIHASGVMATVATGLYLGSKRSVSLSARAKVDVSAVWETIDFILNGIVFILIGLQLPHLLGGIRDMSAMELLLDVAILSCLLIALRLGWVSAASWIRYWFQRLLGKVCSCPPGNETFIVGWTGMRGVICLAAAMSLPNLLDNGAAFPQRNLLVFLTFCVIMVTLVVQGLSLPMLIRKFRLIETHDVHKERVA